MIDDLSITTTDFRNHYFREVVSTGFAATSFIKLHNSRTFRAIALESDFVLCKRIMHLVLDIGSHKMKSINKSYGSIVKVQYANAGVNYD